MDLKTIQKNILDNNYDLSEHAHKERQEEQITVKEIEKTILNGDIIEEYLSDQRGESCLISGKVSNNDFHIVCGTRNERSLIVTVYRPKLPTWIDYKTRTKELKSRG